MKKFDVNSEVLKTLKEFEDLQEIIPSVRWNDSLMHKIKHSKIYSAERKTHLKYAGLISILVLANVGFLSKGIFRNKEQPASRREALQSLAKELLINPSSVNY